MAVILVTDGEERSALAVTRSLGTAGHSVEVCSVSGSSLAGSSRWACHDHSVPSSLTSPDEFGGAVAHLCRVRRVKVVLPVSDASLLALLPRRETLGGSVLPAGDFAALCGLLDKKAVSEAGGRVGLAVPRQEIVADPERQGELADLGWPVVLKPVRSVAGASKHRVSYAHGPQECHRRLEGYPRAAYPVLVQEWIRGPGVGVFLLRWDGVTRAVFAHQRLREKPPEGGVSVYRESVSVDTNLVGKVERLLAAFDWQGVAMVEFKMSRERGGAYLMEVNPRFWGSLQLAVDAGVDFPRLLVDAALGRARSPMPSYRLGVRSRWWWGDVDHLVARLRGAVPADSPDEQPRRWRAIREFLALGRKEDRWEVARASDFRPFLLESRRWLKGLVSAGGNE